MDSRYLPQELVYIIVECLRDDKSTLRSCSLVSHSWTNPAHRLLFHHLQCIKRNKLTRLRDLLDFLGSSQTTSKYTEVLTVDGDAFSGEVCLNGAVLASLLAPLPSLQELHLQAFRITSYEDRFDALDIPASIKALKVLSIVELELSGEGQLHSLNQLLRPISSLDSFRIQGIWSERDGEDTADEIQEFLSNLDLPTRFRVRSLLMRNYTPASSLFIKTFTELPPGTIRSLELDCPTQYFEDMLPEIIGMLKVVGPGLQDLTIHYEDSTFGASAALRSESRYLIFTLYSV